MAYLLKHFDTPVLRFAFHSKPLEGLSVEILELYDMQHLPPDLKAGNEQLLKWLKRRVIPRNRRFVQNLLARLSLQIHDTKGIIRISKGLSLNDCYWVVEDGFSGSFADYNLYHNPFDKVLALIAYTGYGSHRPSDFVSSPELTTDGMLAKAWRRTEAGILLYKAGSTGAANAGNEPYSEYYACQVAAAMGLDAVRYNLSRWKGCLCSTCELFCTQELAYISTGSLVTQGGWPALFAYYQNLGSTFYENLLDMLVFDAVICNEDRHFGNFGLLLESKTNRILKPAPLFDHGLSLFYQAMRDDFKNLEAYAATIPMRSGDDFLVFAREIITPTQKKKLRKLFNFKFQSHSSYRLPAWRLRAIENFIQSRVNVLLQL